LLGGKLRKDIPECLRCATEHGPMEAIQNVLDLCRFLQFSGYHAVKIYETHTKRDTSVIKVQPSVWYGWTISRLGERRTRVLWFF
jgi:hypothetical protein